MEAIEWFDIQKYVERELRDVRRELDEVQRELVRLDNTVVELDRENGWLVARVEELEAGGARF